jgi:hypothetical protein
MLTCPLCKKKLAAPERECPSCHADLSLMVGYVVNLAGGLARAEQMVRDGHLAEAVYAYLEVLDVDPENAEARRQVGHVAAAVRHFDSRPLPRRGGGETWGPGIWTLIVLAAGLLGFAAGMQAERWLSDTPSETVRR